MSPPPFLSLLILTPLLGALALALIGKGDGRQARRVAVGTSLLTFLESLMLLARFDPSSAGIQFAERLPWIPSLGVEYFVGVDGLNLLPARLAALLTPLALMISEPPSDRPRLYLALILMLESGLLGNFTALNFFPWFLCWELSLIPAWFLIRLWGGPGRQAAANQFLLFTFVGSVALLLAFQVLYLSAHTFDLLRLAELARQGELTRRLPAAFLWTGVEPKQFGLILFAGVFAGLAVKIPVFPLHTWISDTYAEAPTGVTLMLTGALSKMGVYGMLRLLLPLFPAETRALLGPLLLLTAVSIVLPALIALAQTDLKRLLAYSSMNHLGYCLLGLFAAMDPAAASATWQNEKAAALNGVLLQLFNHGVTAGLLFAFVALIEQRSEGRRGLDDFGGLRAVAPIFAGLMGMALFASLGLPGLSGFIGEFLIFKGSFALAPGAAVLAIPGLLLTAVFLLTLFQRVFNGPLNPQWTAFPDLTRRELALILPGIALLILPGILPSLLLRWVNATVLDYAVRLSP